MRIKKIMARNTGNFLTADEATRLCYKLRMEHGTVFVEHKSVCGYPTPELAEKANFRAICEEYEGYTFAYVGTVRELFEGYKVLAIAIKQLPTAFETRYPDYVVIG